MREHNSRNWYEFLPIQDVNTCNLTRSLLLQVDDSLTEPRPLLSLKEPGTRFFRSMAYIQHLNTGRHFLFLGTTDGRLFQVKNCQWNDDVQCVSHYNPWLILFMCRLILWIQLVLSWWGELALFLEPRIREMMSPSWCSLMKGSMCMPSLSNR